MSMLSFRGSRSRAFFCSLALFCAAGLIVAAPACKKKDETAGTPATTSDNKLSKKSADPTIKSALLARIPDTAVMFATIDTKHPSYERLAKSPWGGQVVFSKIGTEGGGLKELTAIAKRLGIALDDPKSWKDSFGEALFFVDPGAAPTSASQMALVVQPGKNVKTKELLAVVAEEAKKAGKSAEKFSEDGIEGITVEVNFDAQNNIASAIIPPGAAAPAKTGEVKKITVSTKDGLLVAASDRALAKNTLIGRTSGKAPILESSALKRCLDGLPAEADRYTLGFVDVVRMTGVQGPEAQARFKEAFPALGAVEGFGWSFGMTDVPTTNARLVFNESQKEPGGSFGLQSSSGKQILQGLAGTPLIFLSLDGASVRRLKALAEQSSGMPSGGENDPFKFLSDAERLAVVASIAAPGTSMLPIPNILAAVETSTAPAALETVKQLIGGAMAMSGMPTGMPGMPPEQQGMAQWTEKDISGVKVYSMMAPLGMGAFVAAKQNLLLVSTNETQLREMLGQPGANSFLAKLSPTAKGVFIDTPTVGTLYIDFPQAANFLESMGGMLSMYAPPLQGQGPSPADMVNQENIKALRDMGALVAKVDLAPGVINLSSFYQPSPEQSAKGNPAS